MNNIFKDLLNICVVVYLDDILVFSKNTEDHTQHIQEVLCRLHTNDLFCKLEKCNFSIDTTNFLGYIVSPDGLQMDDAKIQVIKDWPTPRKVKEIQSFLGFANFYRCFIANYSDITIPLTCLTHKNFLWHWTTIYDDTFRLLKSAFSSVPILCHFNPS